MLFVRGNNRGLLEQPFEAGFPSSAKHQNWSLIPIAGMAV